MTALSLHSGGKQGLHRIGQPSEEEKYWWLERRCSVLGRLQTDVLAAGWHSSHALATPIRQAEMDHGNKNWLVPIFGHSLSSLVTNLLNGHFHSDLPVIGSFTEWGGGEIFWNIFFQILIPKAQSLRLEMCVCISLLQRKAGPRRPCLRLNRNQTEKRICVSLCGWEGQRLHLLPLTLEKGFLLLSQGVSHLWARHSCLC